MLICVSVNVFDKLHDLRLPLSCCTCTSLCVISVHVSFASWFSAARLFPRLKGGASHTDTVGQHGWRQLRGRLSKYGLNWSGTFPSSALRCLCVCVSVSPQILRWGPAGADRTFFISPLPLQTLFFFVWTLVCVRVCQQARSALCGSDVNVIDSPAVTRAIERICGKRGTLQPHSFQPWGGEGDECRQRGKRES